MRTVAALIAISAGISATTSVMASERDCALAKSAVAAISAKLPIEVDAVTNTASVAANCDKKQVVLQRTVELKQSRMQANFREFLQKQDDTAFCADKASRALIDAGWKWTVRYTFQDGSPVNIDTSCG